LLINQTERIDEKNLRFVVVVAACFAFSGSVIADELVIVGTGSGSSVLKEVGQAFTMTTPGTVIFVPKASVQVAESRLLGTINIWSGGQPEHSRTGKNRSG